MRTVRRVRLLAAAMVAAVGVNLWASSLQTGASESVPAFLAMRFGMGPRQIAAVAQGQAVAVLLPGAVEREIVVAGAVRIDAPAERTVALVKDIERLESGPGFQTKRLSDPPRLEDFAAFSVTPEDLAALRTCRPGRCDVKLGQGALEDVARINWKSATAVQDVHDLARRAARDYVNAYRQGGNGELAVYRDTERPLFIAQEFSDMVARTSQLPDALPELARFLQSYPAGRRPAGYEDFFYWSVAAFGLKPVFRLKHVLVVKPAAGPTRFAIATKQLYANHYFHTALEIRALVDDESRPGSGHYLIVLNMARSDGLTGVFGGIVKSKATTASREGVEQVLRATKRLAEGR